MFKLVFSRLNNEFIDHFVNQDFEKNVNMNLLAQLFKKVKCVNVSSYHFRSIHKYERNAYHKLIFHTIPCSSIQYIPCCPFRHSQGHYYDDALQLQALPLKNEDNQKLLQATVNSI